NARDAMSNGGKLVLAAENLLLDEKSARDIHGARAGEYVAMSVLDTGTGIPPNVIGRIFEPFFTTKETGKGTGLGLSTVMNIVKNHGGFVSVSSEAGKGSQFKVFLPKAGTAEAKILRAEATDLPVGHGEWVLLADDEASIREISRGTLESYGYRVITAGDGAEAVALYVQNRKDIHVAIVDMVMPFMDGAAAIRALRKLNPEIKIIAISGLMSNIKGLDLSRGGELGVQAFVRKPFSAEQLLKTLHQVLTGH
ncbi:MAG: response regulator, partial [Verrucomicrobia bacterium]|nr:response regulator [Verrucomicrobiota bacterium]